MWLSDGNKLLPTTSHPTIEASEKSGVIIRALVADMGNRNVWSAFGINVGPNTGKVWGPHPCDPTRRLYFMPDPIHVFKNTAEMLRSNKEVHIAPEFVRDWQLPSSVVKLDHIKTLCRFQEKMRSKLAPGLTEDSLKMNQFDKMKVRNATKIYNPRVAAALNFLSTLPEGEPEMRTTAWFITVVCKWYRIMTARRHLHSPEVGSEWKPCQTGVKAATIAILELSNIYLDEVGMDFLWLVVTPQAFVRM